MGWDGIGSGWDGMGSGSDGMRWDGMGSGSGLDWMGWDGMGSGSDGIGSDRTGLDLQLGVHSRCAREEAFCNLWTKWRWSTRASTSTLQRLLPYALTPAISWSRLHLPPVSNGICGSGIGNHRTQGKLSACTCVLGSDVATHLYQRPPLRSVSPRIQFSATTSRSAFSLWSRTTQQIPFW